MRIQFIIIILCLSSFAYGQDTTRTTNNPFEIEQLRVNESNVTNEPDLEDSNSSGQINPFDVNHIPIRKNQISRGTEKDASAEPFHVAHFPLIVLISLLVFLATILSQQRDILNNIISAAVRDYALTDFLKAEKEAKSIIVKLSGVFAILSASLFITLTCGQYVSMGVWSLFLSVAAAILIWYVIKEIVLSILKYSFTLRSLTNYYLAQIKVWNIILGLALLFFSIFIAYGPPLVSNICIYLGIAAIFFCWIGKLLKVLTNSMSNILNQPLQFFVYICAFEISPIMMLVRFLQYNG